MPKSKAKMMADLRDRRRVERKAMLKERSEMFVDVCRTFPDCFTVNVAPATDADPDLTDPVRVRLVFPDRIKPELADYAHRRDMSVDDLFDKLTEEVIERMRRRKMVPDVDRHIVE